MQQAALWAHLADPRATWFFVSLVQSVDAHAPLVANNAECLNEVFVRAQRRGCALPPQVFLPEGIRGAAALAQ
jgi:hypothetical protein